VWGGGVVGGGGEIELGNLRRKNENIFSENNCFPFFIFHFSSGTRLGCQKLSQNPALYFRKGYHLN
jgi:hypothetical protein